MNNRKDEFLHHSMQDELQDERTQCVSPQLEQQAITGKERHTQRQADQGTFLLQFCSDHLASNNEKTTGLSEIT